MVKHWVVVVFDSPVLFEFASHFIINDTWIFSLYIKPHSSTRSRVIYNFTIFNNNFAIFHSVCCMLEGFPRCLELLCNIHCFWIDIEYCNVSVCANPEVPLVCKP